jgi:hypothetical protein
MVMPQVPKWKVRRHKKTDFSHARDNVLRVPEREHDRVRTTIAITRLDSSGKVYQYTHTIEL